MDTQRTPDNETNQPVEPLVRQSNARTSSRRRGGRWNTIRAEAKRRRLRANALVLGTTVAVVALAALFNLLLTR